ncbi:MAG: peptidoglycan DD-metalloendopeptidase family protein [Acidimicrobiales bacterium]
MNDEPSPPPCRPIPRRLLAVVALAVAAAGCASPSSSSSSSSSAAGSAEPVSVSPVPTSTPAPAPSAAEASTPVDAPPVTGQPASTAGPPPTAGSSPGSSPSAGAPDPVRRVFPAAGKPASYGADHHDYPATDIFAACGSAAVSPVDGVIVHWRADDPYDPAADNPAYRGGRSAAVLGDDGVRYYLSHFESMEPGLGVGSRVDAGDRLGAVGRSGNAEKVDCHIHFGLSPDCPAREWAVRRGVIWPAPYLDDWRNARNTSPADEIRAWAAAHPTACTDAAADPTAADAG